MHTFVTKVIEEIKAKEVVEQLWIDNVAALDALETQLNGTTYGSELKSLLAYIEHFANGGNPGNIVKYLKGNTGPTELEFRSKHLRLYAIQEPGKKLIIFGGIKKAADSSDNIQRFRSIKKEYLEFKKKLKDEKGKSNKK